MLNIRRLKRKRKLTETWNRTAFAALQGGPKIVSHFQVINRPNSY